jgi:glyoxylase-like metal-dependent hydrolase (beta-lactamase superfamily II)
MITIQKFVFNTFMVNTYLLYDETKECIIIDAACFEEPEKKQVSDFIFGNKLKLTRNINTHCHVDHVLGNDFIASAYGILPEYHKASAPFFIPLREVGAGFGYKIGNIPPAKGYFGDGDLIKFGNSELKVLYTPGHADGSVCFYQPDQRFVITGDVLFRESIGRTDLPSGDYDILMKSIKEKLFTLPDDVVVYPGHGPETTIGYEKLNNPFIR